MDVSAARALLQKKEGAGSVYDHLVEVVLKVLTDQPANALESFEQISARVKAAAFSSSAGAGAGAADARHGGEAAAAEVAAAVAARVKAEVALFAKPGGEEGPAGEPVQDFTEESQYLEWAGVSFGRTESFRLHLSLKHLAARFPAKSLRFWGKIFGRTADYLVAEGIMDPEDGEEDGAKDALGNVIQKTGEGPNKFTYFVCHEVGGEWKRLPNVTPHQIIVARKIRRLLSGNLDAPVAGHPPFPGKEANYLRAQIALISADTVLAPTGAFTSSDDDPDGAIAPADEWEGPDFSSADSWVHYQLELNSLGRTKPNPPKVDDEGNEVVDEGAPEPSKPLKGIGEDGPVDEAAEEGGGAWDVRALPITGAAEGEPGPVAVVRSLRWPGAVTVGFAKKRWANAYIGNGLPVALAPYQPSLPGPIPAEFDFAGEATRVAEQGDVTKDPDEGKPKEGEEGGEEA